MLRSSHSIMVLIICTRGLCTAAVVEVTLRALGTLPTLKDLALLGLSLLLLAWVTNKHMRWFYTSSASTTYSFPLCVKLIWFGFPILIRLVTKTIRVVIVAFTAVPISLSVSVSVRLGIRLCVCTLNFAVVSMTFIITIFEFKYSIRRNTP
jgi:hypothetical protein